MRRVHLNAKRSAFSASVWGLAGGRGASSSGLCWEARFTMVAPTGMDARSFGSWLSSTLLACGRGGGLAGTLLLVAKRRLEKELARDDTGRSPWPGVAVGRPSGAGGAGAGGEASPSSRRRS